MNTQLVTFGETMIRLSPPGQCRLEQTDLLQVQVGGSEMNAAVAATRLGLRTTFITRLTRNPLGRLIANKAREHGVDTSLIVWTEEDRVGTYFVEFGASPRANSVIYDRKDSAIANVHPGQADWRTAFNEARIFHTSGITFALSPSASETAFEALQIAKEMGLEVSLDLNYRARLWTQERARRIMTEAIGMADILITTEEDTERVFGIQADSYEEVAQRLAQMFDLRVVAITLRKTPSVWRNQWSAIAYSAATKSIYAGPEYDIEVVDRVGSGDAFAGGFLYGYLNGGIEAGVRYGVGISALKQTHPGDLAWATKDEVERALEGESLRIAR